MSRFETWASMKCTFAELLQEQSLTLRHTRNWYNNFLFRWVKSRSMTMIKILKKSSYELPNLFNCIQDFQRIFSRLFKSCRNSMKDSSSRSKTPVINSDRKWKLRTCGRFRTISGHFFANYITIFHKKFRRSFWGA